MAAACEGNWCCPRIPGTGRAPTVLMTWCLTPPSGSTTSGERRSTAFGLPSTRYRRTWSSWWPTRAPPPMGAYTPATDDEGPVITLYRRVVEQGCGSRDELQDLVHDVVVEHTAEMLGVAPETLDPVYRRRY